MKKNIYKNIFLQTGVTILCLSASILLAFGNNQDYKIIALLPIVFLLVNFFLLGVLNPEHYSNIGLFLFYVLSFVKFVISPLFLYFGNYRSNFISLSGTYIANAVFLMSYELVVCTFVVYMTREKNINNRRVISLVVGKRKLKTAPIVLFMALVLLVLWIAVPAIKDNYISIFDLANTGRIFNGASYTDQYASGSTNRVVITLFLVLFGSIRIILPFLVIKILKAKYDNLPSFIISLIIIFLQFIYIPATMLTPFIVVFILLTYMDRIYDKYRMQIKCIIVFSLVFVAFLMYLWFEYSLKWIRYTNITEYISIQLQSYFPGVCNTASIFRVPRLDRIKTFIDTIVACIPFQSSIFGGALFSDDLNNVFGNTYGLKSQIVSTIGGGWYLFGVLFAPIFSAIFTRISMVNGYKYNKDQNDWRRILHLYMCIQTMLGIGIYNIQTTITNWIQVGLVLLVCANIEGESL